MVEPVLLHGESDREDSLSGTSSAGLSSLNKKGEPPQLEAVFVDPSKNRGLGDYGCKHYRRRCQVRAPCCDRIVACRHCHNEEEGDKSPDEHHELPRHQVQKVICSLCDTEQDVQQFCVSCGVCMGQYFCEACKFFDDDTRKKQFHCDECGICRVGGKDKFFHCSQCGCCYSTSLEGRHRCIEKAMNHNCPICFEYLFDSLQQTSVLDRCGHTLHSTCLSVLLRQPKIPACPVCSKSIGDLSRLWQHLDDEVHSTPMPQEYEDKEIPILCNDCGASSKALFHVVGLKCKPCGSYNTRQ